MAAPRPWTVTSHGPIVQHDEGLWSVNASLPPPAHLPRRMTVARRADGTLVLYNAIPLEDAAMRELESFGAPAHLVLPNGFHRLDLHAFGLRYPALRVWCPPRDRARVEERVKVAGAIEDLPPDPELSFIALEGMKNREPLLRVRRAGRVSLMFGDAVFNLKTLAGVDGLVMRLLGSVGGPRVTRIAQWIAISDKHALADHLRRIAGEPGLTRLLFSHGDPIEADAPRVLREVADRLAR
jgi:hypothetical protein